MGGPEGRPFARSESWHPPPSPCQKTRHVCWILRTVGQEMRQRGRSPSIPPLKGRGGGEGGRGGHWKWPGMAMGAAIAVPSGEGGGGDRVSNPDSKRGGIGKTADAEAIGHAGGLSTPWRVDLPNGGPLNRQTSASAQMGAVGNRLPDFRMGKASMCPRRWADTGGIGGGDSPLPSATIRGSKEPGLAQMGAGREGLVLKIRVPPPEFQGSSSAERQ